MWVPCAICRLIPSQSAQRSGFTGLSLHVALRLWVEFFPLSVRSHAPCHRLGLTQHVLRDCCRLYHGQGRPVTYFVVLPYFREDEGVHERSP